MGEWDASRQYRVTQSAYAGSSADLPPLSSAPGDESHRDSPAPKPERLGAFRIIGKLGQGGLGVVYEAEREGISAFRTSSVLYPRDPNARIGLASDYACQGRVDDTVAALDSARGLLDDGLLSALREILSVTAGACESLNRMDYADSPEKAGMDVLLKVTRLAIAASAVGASPEGEDLAHNLSRRFPPAINKSWGRVVGAVGPAILFGGMTAATVKELREAARRNAEGTTLCFLAAASWQNHHDAVEATERRRLWRARRIGVGAVGSGASPCAGCST